MIGSVFSIPSLLDSVGEETVTDMLQTFSCVSEGVQLNEEVEKFELYVKSTVTNETYIIDN